MFKKSVPVLLVLINAMLIGYFSLKITGRQLPTDFVRPLLVSALAWWAIYLIQRLNFRKLALLVFTVLALFQVVMAISYSYYQSIDSFFTGDDVVAIAQSNIEELYDFALHYLYNSSSLLYGGALLALSVLTYLYLNFYSKLHKLRYKKTAFVSAVVFMIAAVVITSQLRQVKYYRLMVHDLQNKIATFHELTAKIESSSVSNASKIAKGELYVLIIGESLCRDNMGLYNHSIDNTPFLSQLGQQENTVVFNNAYSSFVNTVPSITASFSQGNIHTGLTFPEGENLISMAKKSGINTYWISNQVKNGNADTPIGALSSLADYSFFTTNFVFDGSYSQKPDMVLIPELEQLSQKLDSSENNLVIIHIMGNHSPYYNRFPEDYPQIKLNQASQIGRLVHDAELLSSAFNGVTRYDQYLTAIKYNDEFLAQVYEIFGKRPDFNAMVYYSDHAEAVHYAGLKDEAEKTPVGRHNVAQFSYVMSRIPLIVNVSESFKSKYQSSFASMVANKEKIVTNDTLYDFMLDLMQVQSSAINYKFSPANPLFDMGPVDKIKLLANKQVSLDPEYVANVTALEPMAKRLFIRSANALFKANGLLAKGYQGLHVDTVLNDDQLYVKALAEFEDDFVTLDQYLKQLAQQEVAVLVSLDSKVGFDTIKYYVSDQRLNFLVSNKEQYQLLLAHDIKNMVLKLSANELDNLSLLANCAQICVDYETFKAQRTLLEPWLADESKRLFICSDDLNVQELKSVNTIKSLPKQVQVIVKYDNAFNSDF